MLGRAKKWDAYRELVLTRQNIEWTNLLLADLSNTLDALAEEVGRWRPRTGRQQHLAPGARDRIAELVVGLQELLVATPRSVSVAGVVVEGVCQQAARVEAAIVAVGPLPT